MKKSYSNNDKRGNVMKFEILMSCMFQKDYSIIEKSNLENVNVIIINQTDVDKEEILRLNELHTIVNSPDRGVSVSRNKAIEYTNSDICLICDDDECFVQDIEDKVTNAYKEIPDADIIIFKMINRKTKLGEKKRRLKRLELMRVSSVQISFKTQSIKNKIFFDTKLGAGSGNGAGEENKFLLDCYRKGLKIYYYPVEIASIVQGASTWFFGYNSKYFYQLGSVTRYTYGFWFSLIYMTYFCFTKEKIYMKEISMFKALESAYKGIAENRLKYCS